MAELKEIYGMLSTVTVELPYEDAEKQKEADKTNERLKGMGFRIIRAAYDWGYRSYEDTVTRAVKNGQSGRLRRPEPAMFKSGDLVKIFKTVSKGDVQWQGTVDYDRSEYHHGYQKDLAPAAWSAMFGDQLPARLERRDGTVIFGSLEPFSETGTEGVIWSVHEYGKAGYDGLNCLKEGDKLTVYSCVYDGDIEWQGKVDFLPEKVETLGWSEIMRQTNHLPTEKWLEWSWQNRPAVITPR